MATGLFADYFAGALRRPDRGQLHRHLQCCAACRGGLANYLAVVRAAPLLRHALAPERARRLQARVGA
jgi:hypothetical protein